ncbi:MAG: hypothetical protein EZS28_030689 [Streblomastix strix]|uniref:Uncharacterized protein n=1 Tax=Streblomastix strix TaxID=222440 RepID=A0A5J4UU51_9EUKA|nr:MAG: hypothetical protein EZS28_030689 [Streblomastix strix]
MLSFVNRCLCQKFYNKQIGFFYGIANFGSKILNGDKNVTKLVTPALHQVLSTISGPAGTFHPGIEGTLGAGVNLAGAVDRLVNNAQLTIHYRNNKSEPLDNQSLTIQLTIFTIKYAVILVME